MSRIGRQCDVQWFSKCILQYVAAAAAAKSLQSCLTLCDPIDGSPPGSPIPGILQARTLGWVAISLSNTWKWKVKVKLLSRVQLLATPWTAAYQAPPSMGFSRQEYWSGVPLPSPQYVASVLHYDKSYIIERVTGLWVQFSDREMALRCFSGYHLTYFTLNCHHVGKYFGQ